MNQDLFEEFPASQLSDWEKQVQKELKGDNAASLNWENENGFTLPAYFSKEQITYSYSPAFTHNDWRVSVKHSGAAEELNKKMLRDLKHGAEGLSITLNQGEIESCLKHIQLDLISLQLTLSTEVAYELLDYLNKQYKGKTLQITLFSNKMENETDLQAWQNVKTSFASIQGVITSTADAIGFSSKNAVPYYELALVFSQLIEHLSRTDKAQGKSIAIRCSSDTDFFVQIAKLRAYRRLWKLISKEYGIVNSLYLCVESEVNSLSISDSYNNLIRNTLSGMAAVLGGCNELVLLPYDHLLNGDSAFSSRLAMNQQFIFKHESYLDKMSDVACGSYYIESLTDLLCKSALEALKEIETKGGYFSALASGEIEEKLKTQNDIKLAAMQDGSVQRVGVNKFRNEKEDIRLSDEQLRFIRNLVPNHPILAYELKHLQKV